MIRTDTDKNGRGKWTATDADGNHIRTLFAKSRANAKLRFMTSFSNNREWDKKDRWQEAGMPVHKTSDNWN